MHDCRINNNFKNGIDWEPDIRLLPNNIIFASGQSNIISSGNSLFVIWEKPTLIYGSSIAISRNLTGNIVEETQNPDIDIFDSEYGVRNNVMVFFVNISPFRKLIIRPDFVMTISQRESKQNETNIETLNLLIALKKLDHSYRLSEKKIKDLLGIRYPSDFSKLNYFHIITILYYIDDNPTYSSLKIDLEKHIITIYKKENDPFTKSEPTPMFFDVINCPYVSSDSKKVIIRETKYSKPGKEDHEINEIYKFSSWFMEWDSDIDLERVLKKKEWGSSY